MRNVILRVLAGGLICLSGACATSLAAQTRADLAAWSPPCIPAGECPEGALEFGAPRAEGTGRSSTRIGVWPHAVSAFAAMVLASTLDNPVQGQVQDHRSEAGDDLARLARRVGQPEVYVPVALGTVAVGLVAGNGRIVRAGGRITGSLLLAGVAVTLLKPLVGRARPGSSLAAHDFRPFSSQDAWPSGHTAVAFALATSVGDELGYTPARILLYGAATLTGWSRVNDNRHWVTDAVAGALVGVASAKLMNGRWRVFGVSGPAFLLEGNRAGVHLAF
jgi:membrane-associated phospholipid phosphatase